MNFYSRILNAFLILIIILFAVYTWGRSNTKPSEQPAPTGAALDVQLKALEAEVHKNEEESQKWPKLEDVGVWIGIASLIATIFIAACALVFAQTYITKITEDVLSENKELITGRIQGGLTMLACRIQWDAKKSFKRNSTVDLEDYIFRRGRDALAAFDKLKTLKESSKEYRLAAMNNLLFSYGLADNQKYGRAAAELLSDWKSIPAKERRPIMYRLTEIRVEATYLDSVYDLPNKAAYQHQLTKLRVEALKLAKEPDTDQAEVNSLLERIDEAFARLGD